MHAGHNGVDGDSDGAMADCRGKEDNHMNLSVLRHVRAALIGLRMAVYRRLVWLDLDPTVRMSLSAR